MVRARSGGISSAGQAVAHPQMTSTVPLGMGIEADSTGWRQPAASRIYGLKRRHPVIRPDRSRRSISQIPAMAIARGSPRQPAAVNHQGGAVAQNPRPPRPDRPRFRLDILREPPSARPEPGPSRRLLRTLGVILQGLGESRWRKSPAQWRSHSRPFPPRRWLQERVRPKRACLLAA